MQKIDYLDCIDLLNAGKVGLMACDTIWGLVSLMEYNAVSKIFKIKQRKSDQPCLILVDHLDRLLLCTQSLADWQIDYCEQSMEVPTTLILPKAKTIPDYVTAGLDTVGVRQPSGHPIVELLRALKQPLVSTSANISGKAAPQCFAEIDVSIIHAVDFICGDDDVLLGQASRVVDVTKRPVKVIRQ